MEISLFILVVGFLAVYSWTDITTRTGTNQLNDARAILSIENQVIQHEDPFQCVDKMICLLAAQPGRKSCQEAKTSLDLFVNIATCPEHRTDITSYRKAKSLISDYPKYKALLTSSSIGDSTKDESICSDLYTQCPFNTTELLAMVNDLGKATNLTLENPLREILDTLITADGYPVERGTRTKRSCKDTKGGLCGAHAGACGASVVGCALAGIFSFGIGAAACAGAAGAVCTATGSACTVASSQC